MWEGPCEQGRGGERARCAGDHGLEVFEKIIWRIVYVITYQKLQCLFSTIQDIPYFPE